MFVVKSALEEDFKKLVEYDFLKNHERQTERAEKIIRKFTKGMGAKQKVECPVGASELRYI